MPFDAGEYGGAGAAEIALGQEKFGRVRHLAQPSAGHFEHADLVGRTEAVFDRAQNAELVRAFAFERQHGVDHMLDDAGARDLAILGDVADQNHGGAGSLGEADEFAGRSAHLGNGAGRGLDGLRPHGLDRVDDQKSRHGPCDSVATISSTEVSAAISTAASVRPSRSARSRTCATASSPEM